MRRWGVVYLVAGPLSRERCRNISMALEKAQWLALGGSPIAEAELTIEILCAKDPTVIIYKRRGPIPAGVSGQISS